MDKSLDVESFISAITPLLKTHGFKKKGSTWRREQKESIAVFNVQKSQWGGGAYYINAGTYFPELGDETSPTENKCHVRRRLEIEEPSEVINKAIAWFEERASIERAKSLAESDATKGLVSSKLRSGNPD